MNIKTAIVQQEQLIERCNKSIALERLKKRRADTRQKIEFGGLIIKTGMDVFNKSIILGVLYHAFNSLNTDQSYKHECQISGDKLFKER